ncbi:MAG TPA: ATP-binding protein [Methylomirabilota bacterium]|nr:ATP-binding protein [Methylomirabilota bacterium]
MTKKGKARLYLFIGAPGAGKTATALAIAEATGAKHLWADTERHKLFPNPTHSQAESDQLYKQLNDAAEYLLAKGKSVIYDTNFNHYADRQHMREIAARHNAGTVLIWINTPLETAKKRAVGDHETRNGYHLIMTEAQFDSIVGKLEPPRKDEKIIKIDGTKFDKQKVLAQLSL